MKKQFVKFVQNFLKPAIRRIYESPIDFIDWYRSRYGLIPPRSMNFVGTGDFKKTGLEFRDYLIELGDLQANHRVLEVGCGIGRMAIPLTNYLSGNGKYWGIDIVKYGIDWCQNRISPKFSNFHFLHSDIYNKSYNPKGKILARDFEFPFEDKFFDFVLLTSVFTHMLPVDVENYLSEISRVLKSGGKSLITFFVLNDESMSLVRAGRSTLDFKYEIFDCLTIDKDVPESAIGYKEESVADLYEKHELEIKQPIHYGSWCNRESFLSYQDIVIATKTDQM